jgi:transmembrane sensor
MQKHELEELLSRYKAGLATDEEKALLETWYTKHQEAGPLEYSLTEIQEDAGQVWMGLQHNSVTRPKHTKIWVSAAAAILLFISVGGYYLLNRPVIPPAIAKNKTHEITPGGNKAVLTLANGRQIVLADARNGNLANEQNAVINKTSDGQIAYAANTTQANSQILFNTIATPKGGQYKLVLADGTSVFLNAASSLHYPAVFTGHERMVELTGEAYFEVAHNSKMPFKVRSKGQIIEVLGTHFNINAYADEDATVTTLLQGSVKVGADAHSDNFKILKPGQQSIHQELTNSFLVKPADTELAMAWKNGYFEFDRADIKTIMRQISRWYDVAVEYKGTIKKDEYVGRIERNAQLKDVLQMLQFSHIHFKVENNKIIVTP